MKKLPTVKRNAGYYLRVFRAIYRLSQLEAAAFFGISGAHWCLVENGHRHLSPQKAHDIAAVIGCPSALLQGVRESR